MGWNEIFTGILPLLGVFVGGIITYKTQTNTVEKQLEREIEKEKELKNIERLKVYSEILKLEGENLMIERIGGSQVEFNLGIYMEKIRPVLYSKFYLLDKNVAENVRKIDAVYLQLVFDDFEDDEGIHNESFIRLFNKIISDIQNHINDSNLILNK